MLLDHIGLMVSFLGMSCGPCCASEVTGILLYIAFSMGRWLSIAGEATGAELTASERCMTRTLPLGIKLIRRDMTGFSLFFFVFFVRAVVV